MLIPIRHENMQSRRRPLVTIGLIVLNSVVFLSTYGIMLQQARQPETKVVPAHVLLLAAMHPDLNMPDDVRGFVDSVRSSDPEGWAALARPNRRLYDAWDAQQRLVEDPAQWQAEMDTLSAQFTEIQTHLFIRKYGFVPAHPTLVSRLTANFLHSGWLHLIGNMWFLWLAGFILEDTWGRPMYLGFYLLSGVMALQVHGWIYPHSYVPALGASGAVAALMGAFLVRFPTMKIEMAWFFLFFRSIRFKASAYWLLPVWVLMEVLSGSLLGRSSGVAHWAHVGGFVSGMIFAVVIRKSGLEQMAEKHIQDQISWEVHPLLTKAGEQLEKGQLDEALGNINKMLQEKPDSVEALRTAQQIHLRKGNTAQQRVTLEKLIALHLKAGDTDEALRTYEDYRKTGAEALPPALWLDLCRKLEDQEKLEAAAEEYASLARTCPEEKQCVLALLGTARLYLKRLNRPADALRYYEMARDSKVPHAEWTATIEKGLTQARAAVQGPVETVSPLV